MAKVPSYLLVASAVVCVGGIARADNAGAPPPDATQAVAAPTDPNKPPPPPPKDSEDATNVAISLGGQLATGNSQSVAVSGQAKFDTRHGNNAFAAAIVGNYSDGFIATPAPGQWQETTENLQGKLRYDRFFTRNFSVFGQVTGTHDSFQAITFRLNADLGAKYLFVNADKTKFWGELGYDFQYDINYTSTGGYMQAGAGGNALDTNNLPYVIDGSDTIHSVRAFVGFQHAFNKDTQLGLGLEYLQALGGAPGGLPELPAGQTDATVTRVPIPLTPARINFNALFTSKIGAGFAVGIGFNLKYNSDPLPGKENVDTATTLSLIYSMSSKPKKQ